MIIVFGSLNADLVLTTPEHPRPGETVLCTASMLSPGGKGANQAVAAMRAGGEVAMVGRVGADPLGAFLLDRLRADGLDVGGVTAMADVLTGCASVAVDSHGENVIYVASGANMAARAEDVPAALLARASTVLCQMEVPAAETFRLLRRAKAEGRRTMLNLAPARDLDSDGLAAIRDAVDVLVVNEEEAAQLAAHAGLAADGTPAELALRLAAALAGSCVITLGPAGACAATAGETLAVPALPVEVKDTTGAGDTFTGALAAGVDSGRPLATALRFAAVAASLACRRLGAQASMPQRAEIAQYVGAIA